MSNVTLTYHKVPHCDMMANSNAWKFVSGVCYVTVNVLF